MSSWKLFRQGAYVTGFEPATCRVDGRTRDRKDLILQFLAPGASRRFRVEIGIL